MHCTRRHPTIPKSRFRENDTNHSRSSVIKKTNRPDCSCPSRRRRRTTECRRLHRAFFPREERPSFRITELYQRMMERRYLRILASAGSRFESTVSVEYLVAPTFASLAVPLSTPDTIERGSSVHRSDRTKNEFAISSAMPALLVAFNNVSVVGGSAALFAAISRQSDRGYGGASSGEE